MNHLSLVLALAFLAAFVQASPGEPADKTRNPFGVADVPDPDGQDVKDFAAEVTLAGDAKDPNAEQWVKEASAGNKDSLEGEWVERWGGPDSWNESTAPGKLKVVGGRVYIYANCSNGKFLLDLKREGNRLVGRYHALDNPGDSTPCVLQIVNSERIDGCWAGGRWDFRRKLK